MKRRVNIAGNIIAIVAIVFVLLKFRSYGDEIYSHTTIRLILWCALLSFLYFLLNFLLVGAWKKILLSLSIKMSFLDAFCIYGCSQLGKYIPGNIFQLAGRQLLSIQYGLKASLVAKSLFIELLFLVISGGVFCILLIPSFLPAVNYDYALILFFFLITLIFILSFRKNKLAEVLLLQCLFLVLSGFIFSVIIYIINSGGNFSIGGTLQIIVVYIVAWLVGLITPGSPAGVGVREAVLLLLLPDLQTDLILTAVVYGRLVTLVGDVLFYGFAQIFNRERKNV